MLSGKKVQCQINIFRILISIAVIKRTFRDYLSMNRLTLFPHSLLSKASFYALRNCPTLSGWSTSGFHGLQVMWLRRNTDWPSLLTLGNATHISDSRYSVSFQYPNNWRLAISGVRREDRGLYVCQVNTHPPRMLITNVTVLGNIACFCESEKGKPRWSRG